jgi:hypothetical protein
MTFVVAQRITGVTGLRGRSVRARRLLTNRLSTWCRLTPQERADLYVSRLPIAVLAAPNGQ